MLIGATEGGRDKISDQLTAIEARVLRAPLEKERPRTYMPKPARSRFPEIRVAEASAERPTLDNIGAILIPS